MASGIESFLSAGNGRISYKRLTACCRFLAMHVLLDFSARVLFN